MLLPSPPLSNLLANSDQIRVKWVILQTLHSHQFCEVQASTQGTVAGSTTEGHESSSKLLMHWRLFTGIWSTYSLAELHSSGFFQQQRKGRLSTLFQLLALTSRHPASAIPASNTKPSLRWLVQT